MMAEKLVSIILGLLLAPFMLGVINRVKAFIGGRAGQPLFQVYFDLNKLLKKGAVYSRTTSWVFRMGPIVSLSSFLAALLIVPFGGVPALVSFPGDFILLSFLLSLARFVTVIAALDTGSSFEGMGASREVAFSALAEPVFFLSMFSLVRLVNGASLSGVIAGLPGMWRQGIPPLMLVAVALFIVLLAENSRIPVDDPNTHLELTMIHEVMVLDHGGPDLAFILFGVVMKLWVMGSVLLMVLLPLEIQSLWLRILVFSGGMMGLAVAIGLVESVMARIKLGRVPALLVGAMACALFALLLVFQVKP